MAGRTKTSKRSTSRRSNVTKKPKDEVEELLRARDITKRLSAVDLLLKRGDQDGLINLLRSESWHLREKAAQALVSFGQDIAGKVRPLLDEGYWYVRAVSAFIIGEIGDEQAFDRLREMIKERNETVKARASVALAKLIRKNATLGEKLSLEERVMLENNLKALKEFRLIEDIKPVQETQESET